MKFSGFTHSSFLASLLFGLLLGTAISQPAQAQTATTTVLEKASACPNAGCITTLTATVTAGLTSVHPGMVIFCDGPSADCENEAPIGRSQLVSNGSATIKVAFSPGQHTIRAIFHGTRTYARSVSATQTLTVTSTAANRATVSNISAIGSNGGYTLTGSVSGPEVISPTGTLSFVDSSNRNALLFSAPLIAGTTSVTYIAGALDISKVASPLTNTQTAVTGDFNNDGFQDVAQSDGTNLTVILGNGKGSFTTAPAPAYQPKNGFTTGLLALDLNGDGKLDLVILGNSTKIVEVAFGNGDGTFTTGPTTSLTENLFDIRAGDANGDGIPDLIYLGHTPSTGDIVQTLLGKGDGTFAAQTASAYQGHSFSSVAIADFNCDGILDFAVADDTNGSILVYTGIGDGTFAVQPTVISNFANDGLVAGDFDGDGIPDLVAALGLTQTFLHGNGNGTFTQKNSLAFSAGGEGGVGFPSSGFLGDFNGDGKLDVAYQVDLEDLEAFDQGSFVILTNDGSGNFTISATIPSRESGAPVSIADFSGDQIPDLLVYDANDIQPPATYVGGIIATATAVSDPGFILPGVGMHNIVASFPGDGYYTASFSAPLALLGTAVNCPTGFSASSALALNGAAALHGSTIELTDGEQFEAGSFFNSARVPIESFSTTFDFQLTDAAADGFAFVIEGNGPDALGSSGGGLGYGTPPGAAGESITNSVAIAFDLHNNQGEGNNSVRLEYNGITSATASGYAISLATDLTPSGIDLHSGHKFHATITYGIEGQPVILLTLKDLQTNAVFSDFLPNPAVFADDPMPTTQISSFVGGSMAYVGFTGGTGVGTAVQTIDNWVFTPTSTGGAPYISPSYQTGFAGRSQLHFNGGAAISGSAIDLTHGTTFEAPSVYFTPQLVTVDALSSRSQFQTDFDFQIENGIGDGFTFVVQNQRLNAQGSSGGGLGYGPDHPAGAGAKITNSVAIKFDLHNNAGEGTDSTGIYANGASPTTPSVDLSTSGINLSSGHVFHAHIVSNNTERSTTPGNTTVNFGLILTDLNVYRVFSTNFKVDVPAGTYPAVGYVGFTAGTGATPSSIKILNWTWGADQF